MELQSISQVSKQFHVSTRTLRYYEQIGLITPTKKADSAYRAYDADALLRLRQILILRKLRIPLKQIAEVLKSNSTRVAIEVLEQNLSEIEDELTALSTIRSILKSFVEKLDLNLSAFALPDDESLLEIVDSLTVSKIDFKGEMWLKEPSFNPCFVDFTTETEAKSTIPQIRDASADADSANITMDDLNKASEKLHRLTDREVRIVYLPPSAVAAYQYVGEEPEMHCHQVMDKFVRDSGLIRLKPDTRHYGFNAPNPVDETGYHGYEVWVTIPDDMEVPVPIVKKQFEGGLYAAHMIPFGAFEEWGWLCEWVEHNPSYRGNSGDKGAECMWGLLEEHLNFVNHVQQENSEPDGFQLDLLHPIRERD